MWWWWECSRRGGLWPRWAQYDFGLLHKMSSLDPSARIPLIVRTRWLRPAATAAWSQHSPQSSWMSAPPSYRLPAVSCVTNSLLARCCRRSLSRRSRTALRARWASTAITANFDWNGRFFNRKQYRKAAISIEIRSNCTSIWMPSLLGTLVLRL